MNLNSTDPDFVRVQRFMYADATVYCMCITLWLCCICGIVCYAAEILIIQNNLGLFYRAHSCSAVCASVYVDTHCL